jgi:hypothetical protein
MITANDDFFDVKFAGYEQIINSQQDQSQPKKQLEGNFRDDKWFFERFIGASKRGRRLVLLIANNMISIFIF